MGQDFMPKKSAYFVHFSIYDPSLGIPHVEDGLKLTVLRKSCNYRGSKSRIDGEIPYDWALLDVSSRLKRPLVGVILFPSQ